MHTGASRGIGLRSRTGDEEDGSICPIDDVRISFAGFPLVVLGLRRGETEPLNANGDAALSAADKRVQQEAGKSRPHGGPVLHALQLLQSAQNVTRCPHNGCRINGSRLVAR